MVVDGLFDVAEVVVLNADIVVGIEFAASVVFAPTLRGKVPGELQLLLEEVKSCLVLAESPASQPKLSVGSYFVSVVALSLGVGFLSVHSNLLPAYSTAAPPYNL